MPLDELGEIAFKGVWRIFVWLFFEILFEVICYYLGKIFLLVITFGQYKPKHKDDGSFESFVGLALLLVAFVTYLIII